MAEQEVKTPVATDVAENRKKMIKKIVIIAVIALAAWFIYRKFIK
jgi:hypothetical protein